MVRNMIDGDLDFYYMYTTYQYSISIQKGDQLSPAMSDFNDSNNPYFQYLPPNDECMYGLVFGHMDCM